MTAWTIGYLAMLHLHVHHTLDNFDYIWVHQVLWKEIDS